MKLRKTSVKCLQMFEPGAMQNKQKRHDFAVTKTGIRTTHTRASANPIGAPLRLKYLAKIINLTEYLSESFQHGHLQCLCWAGSPPKKISFTIYEIKNPLFGLDSVDLFLGLWPILHYSPDNGFLWTYIIFIYQ